MKKGCSKSNPDFLSRCLHPANMTSETVSGRQSAVSFKQVKPHLTCYSPLRVRDSIPDMRPLPPIAVQRHLERDYVVDAVKSDALQLPAPSRSVVRFLSQPVASKWDRREKYQKSLDSVVCRFMQCRQHDWVHDPDQQTENEFFNSPYHRPLRTSIIRPYNAMNDRHSAGYFRSPIVKEVVTRTLSAKTTPSTRPPPEKRGLHRMSARHRSIPTPPPSEIDEREKRFTLDNIRAERLRNKQRPIVVEYDAALDPHSARYFRRKLVRNILRKTVAQPQRLYPTINFYAPTKNDLVV